MLKKLVKYGNSKALLLDRTILSLLNIKEDSILKLRVEGNTLIIKTHEEEIKTTDSLMLEVESIHNKINSSNNATNAIINYNEAKINEYCKKVEQDPQALKTLKEWLPGTENSKKLQQTFAEIMQKYSKEMEPLSSKKFLEDAESLTKKYQGNITSKDYYDEFLKLRLKYAPKLSRMDKEMKEASKKLGCPN